MKEPDRWVRDGLDEPLAPEPIWLSRSQQPPPRERYLLHAALFLVTVASVWAAGGPLLALGLLPILFSHEMGHYIACRRYGVSATLPYFIPSPWYPIAFPAVWIPLSFVGTLGAVIRIRSPIPNRKALFDIGLAGPVAGFVVCLPILVLGLLEAEIRPTDPDALGIALGEPLLFQWMSQLVVGEVPAESTMYLGPLGLAAWFGLFITALNLIPIGQLDGGHVTYAWLGPRAFAISRMGSWICLALTYFGPNWLVWSILLSLLGRRHPPTLDDSLPLDRTRVIWAYIGLAIFVVCFVPNPIEWSWADFGEAMGWFGASNG